MARAATDEYRERVDALLRMRIEALCSERDGDDADERDDFMKQQARYQFIPRQTFDESYRRISFQALLRQ
ncbi:hypothetical protein JCM3774_005769 [Rhodotorula dairenensis]